MRKYLAISLVMLTALVMLVACSNGDDESEPADADSDSATTEIADDAANDESAESEDVSTEEDADTDEADVSGELLVFTAGSLTAAFEEMKAELEAMHGDLSIVLNIGNSAALRTQLEEGAQADVYASANIAQMDAAQEADRIDGDPFMFARNRLVLIVPADNPAGIESLADLAEPDTLVVLAQEQVPVGAYAREAFDLMSADPEFGEDFKDRVMENVVSEEQTVMAVVTKVQLGEADAGIVFVSELEEDVLDEVQVIDIPDEFNVIAEYPIAKVDGAPNPDAADAFIDFVLGSDGKAILEGHGFLPPEE